MIRQKISEILEVRIQEGKWEAYTRPLDREGKFTRATIIRLTMAICEAIEDQEKQITELTTRMEGLKGVILKLEKEHEHKTRRDTKVPVQS